MSNKDKGRRVDTGQKDSLGRPIYNWDNDTDAKSIDHNTVAGVKEDFNNDNEALNIAADEVKEEIEDNLSFISNNDDTTKIVFDDKEMTVSEFAETYSNNIREDKNVNNSFKIVSTFNGNNYFETQANKKALERMIKDNHKSEVNNSEPTVEFHYANASDLHNDIENNSLAERIITLKNVAGDDKVLNSLDHHEVLEDYADNLLKNDEHIKDYFEKSYDGFQKYLGIDKDTVDKTFTECFAQWFHDYDSQEEPKITVVDIDKLVGSHVFKKLTGKTNGSLYPELSYKEYMKSYDVR